MFLPTLRFKHVSCWHFICNSFLAGGINLLTAFVLQTGRWEGCAAGLCRRRGLGDGDGDRGPLPSRDRAISPDYAVREGLKYGVERFFRAACKAHDSSQQEAVGKSEKGVRSDQARGWEGGPCRTGRWPQPGASHLPGLYAKRFLKSHLSKAAALLNSLLLPRSA